MSNAVAKGATGADQLSSSNVIPTSPADARQGVKNEPEQTHGLAIQSIGAQISRRKAMNIVVGATALAGQAIPQTVLASEAQKGDPIYDLISKHRTANEEYYKALEIVPGTVSPDPEKEDLYGNRESDIRWELASTTPETLSGLVALLSYVVGVTEGPCSPSGKPDIAFEASGELFNIVAGALECLERHLPQA